MLIYILVIIVYLSFLLDFLVWPVPSEASTSSLLNEGLALSFKAKLLLIVLFALNFIFYVAPLGLSVYYLVSGYVGTTIFMAAIGMLISITGRFISVKAAIRLRKNDSGVVSDSLFRYSRNPISLGLHMTMAGMLLIFGKWYLWLCFMFYLLNIHYKIKIEENKLVEMYGSMYAKYMQKTPRYLLNIKW